MNAVWLSARGSVYSPTSKFSKEEEELEVVVGKEEEEQLGPQADRLNACH
jgi:hypothetical protein